MVVEQSAANLLSYLFFVNNMENVQRSVMHGSYIKYVWVKVRSTCKFVSIPKNCYCLKNNNNSRYILHQKKQPNGKKGTTCKLRLVILFL